MRGSGTLSSNVHDFFVYKDAFKSLFKAEMVVMHYFADRLQAGPLARTYMLGYEQMMHKKNIKSRKYHLQNAKIY